MRPLKITIAGAGIGGLAAALALARDGHSIRVIERAHELSQVGAGIQVSPNGMAVLGALGLEEFPTETVRLEAVRLRDGPNGREVATLDFRRHAGDLRWQLSHRSTLVAQLAAAARCAGAAIDLGVDCMPPPAGQALEGEDLLIGADGIKSRMRTRVDNASNPFFTGQVAWRTVIPDARYEPVVEVHMGPGRHLVTYPIEGGQRNIVAFEERANWVEESWTHEDDPNNLRAAFSGFGSGVRRMLESVESVHLWGPVPPSGGKALGSWPQGASWRRCASDASVSCTRGKLGTRGCMGSRSRDPSARLAGRAREISGTPASQDNADRECRHQKCTQLPHSHSTLAHCRPYRTQDCKHGCPGSNAQAVRLDL